MSNSSEDGTIEAALRTSEESYRLLADSVPDQVWTAGLDGHLNYVNRRVVEYFGRSAEEVIGAGWQAVVHPEDLATVLENWTHSLNTGAPYEVEFRLMRADGAYRMHIGRALSHRDEHGNIVKWFGTNTDVEDQRRTEAALRERDQQMSRALKMRDEIASIVTHDLRNPLNSMMMAASTLLELDVGAEQRQSLLEIICRSGNLANRLLNDLLDASRIESGHLSIDLDAQNVHSIVEETCQALNARAAQSGLTIETDVTEDLPPVLGDRGRLLQVLGNLVTNAIKYSPDGGTITVRAELTSDGDEVMLSVSDTGIGIAPTDLPHVFDRFWQARRASRAGAGLGLAIAKGIIEAHGGAIHVDSQQGVGSTFTFTIPRAAQVPEAGRLAQAT